jgi:hypothetical protein
LPRPIVIPKVMTLSTLEDVRALMHNAGRIPRQGHVAASRRRDHGRGAESATGRGSRRRRQDGTLDGGNCVQLASEALRRRHLHDFNSMFCDFGHRDVV